MIENINEKQQLTTPVLLIAFNRPDTARKVFDCIRSARPTHFYLAVDGARPNKEGEAELCRQCQEIANLVDWECEVHTLFRDKNVGCGFGPSGAISWAFETAAELIVLEDDCCPSQSFFTFCEQMLNRYKNDNRIWLVSGLSIYPDHSCFNGADYLFTHMGLTWGWATWKDRWGEFDMYMRDVPEFIANGGSFNTFPIKKFAKSYDKSIQYKHQHIEEEVSHSWDSQWDYTRVKNAGLGIIPRINLIEYIGFDNGTHQSDENGSYVKKALDFDHPIKHPKFVVENKEFDEYFYKHYINPWNRKIKGIAFYAKNPDKIATRLKRFVGK